MKKWNYYISRNYTKYTLKKWSFCLLFTAISLYLLSACDKPQPATQAETTPGKAEKPSLMLSNSQIALANISTKKIGNGNYTGTMLLKGTLQANPEASEVISSRYGGRIEKLFIKETGIQIAKGTPIFSVYSEDLLALQQDYLLNLKQQESFPDESIYKKLTQAALNKLKLYGLTNQQIALLQKTRKTDAKITVFAPVSGIVKEVNVSEGSYVTEGSPVLMIDNLQTLWLEADVYPADLAQITLGQKITAYINGYEHHPVSTKIDFISPQLDDNTQKVRVRASVPNPNGNYQAGMYAQADLHTSSVSDVLKLPVNAIIRDENTQHVWVKSDENTFEPRLVKTGAEDENLVIIESGLSAGEEVAVSGVYLLYSEYKLKKGNLQF